MTLHLIGKSNPGRHNPGLNQTDLNTQPLAHNTTQFTYKSDGNSNPQRVILKNAITLSYDDQGRIIKIDGFEPRLVNYPVTIEAQYGFDVYADILLIPPPTT